MPHVKDVRSTVEEAGLRNSNVQNSPATSPAQWLPHTLSQSRGAVVPELISHDGADSGE